MHFNSRYIPRCEITARKLNHQILPWLGTAANCDKNFFLDTFSSKKFLEQSDTVRKIFYNINVRSCWKFLMETCQLLQTCTTFPRSLYASSSTCDQIVVEFSSFSLFSFPRCSFLAFSAVTSCDRCTLCFAFFCLSQRALEILGTFELYRPIPPKFELITENVCRQFWNKLEAKVGWVGSKARKTEASSSSDRGVSEKNRSCQVQDKQIRARSSRVNNLKSVARDSHLGFVRDLRDIFSSHSLIFCSEQSH